MKQTPFVAGLVVGLCTSIAGVFLWQMRYFGSFSLIWAIVTLCLSILVFVIAKRKAKHRRTFLAGALTTVPIPPAATAIFVILLNRLLLTGFNPGVDPTPPGCDLRKVTAAWYQARTNRIFIHLSDDSTYWAASTIEYLSWKDKHLGEFEAGSNVIVCPPKAGEKTWYIRDNIVGELGNDFHRVPSAYGVQR
jgi:hypothetical protein